MSDLYPNILLIMVPPLSCFRDSDLHCMQAVLIVWMEYLQSDRNPSQAMR